MRGLTLDGAAWKTGDDVSDSFYRGLNHEHGHEKHSNGDGRYSGTSCDRNTAPSEFCQSANGGRRHGYLSLPRDIFIWVVGYGSSRFLRSPTRRIWLEETKIVGLVDRVVNECDVVSPNHDALERHRQQRHGRRTRRADVVRGDQPRFCDPAPIAKRA